MPLQDTPPSTRATARLTRPSVSRSVTHTRLGVARSDDEMLIVEAASGGGDDEPLVFVLSRDEQEYDVAKRRRG